ncbi:hypothetical protein HDV03_005462 [Kappamyces sp. JEL0829]|nr:hypothetical protein HDV03_005462 [Kappamyces sp. JEL0829]
MLTAIETYLSHSGAPLPLLPTPRPDATIIDVDMKAAPQLPPASVFFPITPLQLLALWPSILALWHFSAQGNFLGCSSIALEDNAPPLPPSRLLDPQWIAYAKCVGTIRHFQSSQSEKVIEQLETTKVTGTIAPGNGTARMATTNHETFVYQNTESYSLPVAHKLGFINPNPHNWAKTAVMNTIVPGEDAFVYSDCLFIHPLYRKTNVRALLAMHIPFYDEMDLTPYPFRQQKLVHGFATSTDAFGERGGAYNLSAIETSIRNFARITHRSYSHCIVDTYWQKNLYFDNEWVKHYWVVPVFHDQLVGLPAGLGLEPFNNIEPESPTGPVVVEVPVGTDAEFVASMASQHIGQIYPKHHRARL